MMKEMMEACAEKCKWCPVIPLVIGVIFFLLGYFLSPEVVRILWLIFSGIMILMGALCLIMMNFMAKAMSEGKFKCSCDATEGGE